MQMDFNMDFEGCEPADNSKRASSGEGASSTKRSKPNPVSDDGQRRAASSSKTEKSGRKLPSLFRRGKMGKPTIVKAPAAPSSLSSSSVVLSQLQNWDVEYRHLACRHRYCGDGRGIQDMQILDHNDPEWPLDQDAFYILTPRWCTGCREQRTSQIRIAYCARVIGAKDIIAGTYENAYKLGVRDGRISALSKSAKECGVEQKTTKIRADFDDLVEQMTNLKLRPDVAKKPEDQALEELAEQYGEKVIVCSERDDDLKYRVFWHLAYDEGLKDGCTLQAELEMEALHEQGDNRTKRMEQAVL